MEENDIEELFLSVAECSENQTDEVRGVFSVLIRSTLQYRDDMLESKGTVITVEDVRMTLECLVPFLETDRLPETSGNIRLDLLRIWKEELDRIG